MRETQVLKGLYDIGKRRVIISETVGAKMPVLPESIVVNVNAVFSHNSTLAFAVGKEQNMTPRSDTHCAARAVAFCAFSTPGAKRAESVPESLQTATRTV